MILANLLVACANGGSAECTEPQTWYRDADGDGQGDPNVPKRACVQPGGYTEDWAARDCDDTNADVYVSAPETCDDIDDNCNGLVDDEEPGALTGEDVGVWFPDDDGDGYAVEFDIALQRRRCHGGEGLSDVFGDCDDDDPTRYPGAPEVCGDGIDSSCGGADCGEIPLDDADLVFEGREGSYAGYSVAAGHDLDGDGVDDVVIGAPWAELRGAVLGAAYVVSGRRTGTIGPEDTDATIYDFWGNDSFGYRVDTIGDANGDGLGEVLVTAHAGDRVQLFTSPLDGTTYSDVADATITVDSEGDYWISGVDAGDNDADGVGDYVVAGATAAGESGLFVVSGALRGAHDVEEAAVGAVMGEMVGSYPSGVQNADIDGDGLGDVFAVCLSCGDEGEALVGLYSGPVSGYVPASEWDTSFSGVFVRTGVGDFDGDGHLDVAAVAPGTDAQGVPAVVDIFVAPSKGLIIADEADAVWVPSPEVALTGEVRALADIDGDGRDELAVGAPNDYPEKYPTDFGNVWIWAPRGSGVSTGMPSARLAGDDYFGLAGVALEMVGSNSALGGGVTIGGWADEAWIVGRDALAEAMGG